MATYYINPSFGVNGDGSAPTLAGAPDGIGAFNSWANCQAAVSISGGNSFLQASGTTDVSAPVGTVMLAVDGDGASATDRLIIGAYHAATGVEITARDYVDTPMIGPLVDCPADSWLSWILDRYPGFNPMLPVPSGFVRPVVDGSEVAAIDADCSMVNTGNYKYITIRDLAFTLWDTRASVTGLRRGIMCPSSVTIGDELVESQTDKDLVIERCWVHHIGAPTAFAAGTKNANNIGIRRRAGANLTVRGCLIEDIAEDGMYISGINHTIQNCLIRNCDRQSSGGDCIQQVSFEATPFDDSNILIDRCVLDQRATPKKQAVAISNIPPGTGGKVRRSIILGYESGGVTAQRVLNIDSPGITVEACFVRGGSISGVIHLGYDTDGTIVQTTVVEPTYGGEAETCNGIVSFGDGNIIRNNTIWYKGSDTPTNGSGISIHGAAAPNDVHANVVYGTAYGIQNTTGAVESYNVVHAQIAPFVNLNTPPGRTTVGVGSIDAVPDLSGLLPNTDGNCAAIGRLTVEVRGINDLPLPSKPDAGAFSNPDYPGRKTAASGIL